VVLTSNKIVSQVMDYALVVSKEQVRMAKQGSTRFWEAKRVYQQPIAVSNVILVYRLVILSNSWEVQALVPTAQHIFPQNSIKVDAICVH
jgi:hypothetical protein